MASRFNLMHEIAELDQQLSRSSSERLPQEHTGMLKRCAEILDSAEKEDEYAIGQAIHYLMRKHDLHPRPNWPDAQGVDTRYSPESRRLRPPPLLRNGFDTEAFNRLAFRAHPRSGCVTTPRLPSPVATSLADEEAERSHAHQSEKIERAQ